MIPASLVDNLCEFLRQLLKDYVLKGRDGTQQPPKILPGYVSPVTDFGNLTAPFVMVGAASGRDTGTKATIQVKIWIGGCCPEQEEHWRGPLNLLTHIRQELFKKRVIAKKFRMEYPLKWEISEEYTSPEFLAIMTTNWAVARPVEEVIYEQDSNCRLNWAGTGDLLRP